MADTNLGKHTFLKSQISRTMLVLNLVLAIAYFVTLTFLFPVGSPVLFGLLVGGEVFHVWLVATFIFTVWSADKTSVRPQRGVYLPPVDVFITVAGEPVDIIAQTVLAAKQMDYPNFKIFILNDGLATGKENWREVIKLAKKIEVECLTRTRSNGAKAGNINNALTKTTSQLVAIFDADHKPLPNFLSKTVPYFSDPQMGFVQTPQYYANHELNQTTSGAWEQQEVFFGPILRGKNSHNAVFMCGTNMVIRRQALESVDGFVEDNITEDFVTSVFMHQQGWKSVYHPQVLSEGLAPEDFLSYYKQQFRWSRGSLEIIFKHNPLFKRNLTWKQKIEYLSSASFYLSGLVVLIDIMLPLVFFFTGRVPLRVSTMALAGIFLPYIFLTIYNLQLASNFSFTFRALSFSFSSFTIQLKALLAVLTGRKSAFAITSKKKIEGNFVKLAAPHIAYIFISLVGMSVAVAREGLSASVVANLAWAVLNSVIFLPFIFGALGNLVIQKVVVAPDTTLANLPSKTRPIADYDNLDKKEN